MFVSVLIQITENRLRELFSKKGNITDIQLKYTNEGVFRQFAFIGYQSNEEAAAAVDYFNNTCINTSRVKVEVCAALGAETKPKSWSKYSADSSSYKKLQETEPKTANDEPVTEKASAKIKPNKNERLDGIFGEHKNDPKFIEFMKVHSKGNDIWDNDLGLTKQTDDDIVKKAETKIPINDSGSDADEDEGVVDGESDEEEKIVKLANQEISDSDYLKSLMSKKEPKADTTEKTKKSSKITTEDTKKITDLFTIKIRDIPFKTKRKDLIKFFKPVKPYSIRLPTRVHGFCYVGFKTEKEFTKAMLKNRSFLSGKQVLFTDFTEKNKETTQQTNDKANDKLAKNPKWAKQEDALKNEEDISESGRIFFRNLTYTVNEDLLQQLFEKYGPVTEVNVPIDPATRQIKGFGTVTFVMPEHAVKAFTELDGSVFHGRLLHLIPGKSKADDELNDPDAEGLSYKQKKDLKLKQTANSAHNWNALFMGANAVANSLAKNYQTTKEDILDTAGGGSSAAVRLALGETELIMEMRNFLESNDVVLDVFNQAPMKRSKTVILVKNLPADTTIGEIQPLFAKFGLLGRIVLPPSGVTAIVEFLDSSEAKKAFSKLAYSKFKSLPLYLEWAPENTFKSAATVAMKTLAGRTDSESTSVMESSKKRLNAFSKENFNAVKKGIAIPEVHVEQIEVVESHVINEDENKMNSEEENDNDANVEPEPETTLFLRNLNFSTREDAIRQHFKHIGKIHHIQVALKKDPENPQNRISLGYGFIQFKLKSATEKALKNMQITNIEGNTVELKRSDRTLQ